MNANDIAGHAAILFFIVVIAFFTTPVGMAILGLLITVAVAAIALDSYASHEPWTVSEPNKFGSRQILAKGYMDKGHFVLTRERAPGGNYVYPYILTLSVFDRRRKLISSVAKLVRDMEYDGRFIIGTYRGRSVIISSDQWSNSTHCAFGEPNGYDTWQVFPPTSDVPPWLAY